MILFSYNFPHKKTMDFVFLAEYYGFKIDHVIAAPHVVLPEPKRKYKSNIPYMGLIETENLCFKKGIPYSVMPHNSDECIELLQKLKPTLGLISGARILSKKVIECFSKGIVNFHPGLIPECRGLDTAHWVGWDNLPVGVTSHFIDNRVDAGNIIQRKKVSLPDNPSLRDISFVLYQAQLEIFYPTIRDAHNKNKFELVTTIKKPYKYFPPELEEELMERINAL